MISDCGSVTGRPFRQAPQRLRAADAGALSKFRRPCECRPADRGSVAEVLERRQHGLAAHRAFDGEQIPLVLPLGSAFALDQEGGILEPPRMTLPPDGRTLHAIE